jgi:acyl dehydratase
LRAAETEPNDRFDRSAIGIPVYHEPFAVTAESIAAYRDAIGANARTAVVAPSIYVCVPAWRSAWAAMARFDRRLDDASAEGLGLHESHVMRFGRPIVPGMVLTTRSYVFAMRATSRGTTAHLMTETFDADGTFVASQHSASVFRDETGDESIGDLPAESDPIAASVYRTAADREGSRTLLPDQGVCYAKASGDDAPLHVDDAAAQRLGLPGSIVQGMCLLAIACDTAAQAIGVPDMRLTSIRTRFVRPVRPGAVLTTRMWELPTTDDGRRKIAFETADDSGKTVLKHGAVIV